MIFGHYTEKKTRDILICADGCNAHAQVVALPSDQKKYAALIASHKHSCKFEVPIIDKMRKGGFRICGIRNMVTIGSINCDFRFKT
jgi:hypothetical protein